MRFGAAAMNTREHLLCLVVVTAIVFVSLVDLVGGCGRKGPTGGHVVCFGR